MILNFHIKTLSIKFENELKDYRNKIFVFWHSKMYVGWWLFKNKNFIALVSKSNDGELLSNVLKKWNYQLIRGSSSKGGKEALKQILNNSSVNQSFVITPDGPRGPALEFKNGPLFISNKKNLPIVPVKITFSGKFVFKKSWDSFELPLPFTKCNVTFGKEFLYEGNLSGEELTNYKNKICDQL